MPKNDYDFAGTAMAKTRTTRQLGTRKIDSL
jgi:hypothetical protein